jgi:hypothetical protein
MSATLVLPEWKSISTSDMQLLSKTYSNLIAGKTELIYRIYLRDEFNIDCIRKKPLSKASASDADVDATFVKKINVYAKEYNFNAVENHPIKEFKQYILFSLLLMINYENPNIKQFVDSCNAGQEAKTNIINTQFKLLSGGRYVCYEYFNTIEENCYRQLLESTKKIGNVPSFSQEVHDKCIIAAFKDAANAYIFEKASTYAFNSYPQQLSYLQFCNGVKVIEDFLKLYEYTLKLCAVKKPGESKPTGTGKGKGKGKSNQPIEAEDEELETEENEEIAL